MLRGQGATCRLEPRARQLQAFTTTADLRRRLQELRGSGAGAVFHAAAVSDFSFGRIFATDAVNKLVEIKSARKIPTRQGKLLVELLPTPKIIAELRGWFPPAKIVGWKFEADGRRAEAVEVARRQIAECSTDLCVVNGPAYGEGFGLVGKKGAPAHLANPTLLFDALEKFARK